MRDFIQIVENTLRPQYRYVCNCVDSYMNGPRGEAIHDMTDQAEDIDFADLVQAVGMNQLHEVFDNADDLENDWAVSYHKSVWRGIPCVYVQHSHIEYIFTLDGQQPETEWTDEEEEDEGEDNGIFEGHAFEEEVFHFGADVYDVELAWWLIDNGHIQPTPEQLPLEQYARAFFAIDRTRPLDQQSGQTFLLQINHKHAAALPPERLQAPGLMAETEHGCLLIDGNNRAARLYHEGVEMMSVLIIAKADRQKILKNGKGYRAAKKMQKAARTNIVEATETGESVSLLDIYTPRELSDDEEMLGQVGRMYWKVKLPVRVMNPEEAKQCTSVTGEPIYSFFSKHASKRQRQIVAHKVASFDRNRIIVLEEHTVIDGNHHLIAAIRTKQPVRYIDLTDLDEAMKAQFPIKHRPPPEEN